MRGTNRNRRNYSGGALEQKAAQPSSKKGPDPGDKVVVDPFRAQGGAENVGIDVVKSPLNVKEQR